MRQFTITLKRTPGTPQSVSLPHNPERFLGITDNKGGGIDVTMLFDPANDQPTSCQFYVNSLATSSIVGGIVPGVVADAIRGPLTVSSPCAG